MHADNSMSKEVSWLPVKIEVGDLSLQNCKEHVQNITECWMILILVFILKLKANL